MSSLRNAVKRITHKERSQPNERARLGILEKKKDYKVRSQDYHKKQDALKNLRRKATMRNPDEFYFGMNNSMTIEGGRHRKLEAAKAKEMVNLIGPEAVKLMKTQDLSYVRMQTMTDTKKIEKMQANLHLLSGDDSLSVSDVGGTYNKNAKRRKHTIFLDNKEKAKKFDVAEHFATVPEMAGRAFNRPRKETLIRMSEKQISNCSGDDQDIEPALITKSQLMREANMAKKIARNVTKARSSAYKEIYARQKRIQLLKHTEAHLVTEKIVASKGSKRKIKPAEDGKPAVYKFRRKRMR